MARKMNTKINKLALCALLSAGVLSAVSGDDDVNRWLKMDSVELFNELSGNDACKRAFGKVVEGLRGKEGTHDGDDLLDLAKGLSFLCGLWAWLGNVDPAKIDGEKLFSRSAYHNGRGEESEMRRKLFFLRDADWGKDLKVKNGNDMKKFQDLAAKCDGFI